MPEDGGGQKAPVDAARMRIIAFILAKELV